MKWTDKRPMSPHLSIWKWHPAMLSSILHRACAIVSYITLIAFSVLLLDLALGGALFGAVEGLLYSPLGAIKLAGICFVLVYLSLNQIRHSVWDAGKGFEPALANRVSIILILAALVIAIAATVFTVGRA